MRMLFSRIIIIIIMALTGLTSGHVSAITPQKKSPAMMTIPDLNYPETAKAEAEKHLKEAQAKGDGPACAFQIAILTYCDLNKERKESAPACLRRLETMKAQETRNDIKALYAFLEAILLKQYANDFCKNRFDDANVDPSLVKQGANRYDEIAAWTHKSIMEAADKEYELALDLTSANLVDGHLPYPISNYEGLLCMGDEWGNRAIPTLYDFMMSKAEHHIRKKRLEQWLQLHASDSDVLPSLMVNCMMMHNENSNIFFLPQELYDKAQVERMTSVYEKYKEHEEVGLLLTLFRPSRNNYLCHRDYLERHPKSRVAESINHDMVELASVVIRTSTEGIIPLDRKIEVTVEASNANDIFLTLMRIPDDEWTKHVNGNSWGTISRNKLKAVEEQKCHIEHALPFWDETTQVTFSAQTPGRYAVSAQYLDKNGKRHYLTGDDISVSNTIIISDLEAYAIHTRDGQKKERNIVVVNRRTGAPVADATVRFFSWKKNKTQEYSSMTGSDGITPVRDSLDLAYFQVSKNNDRYLDKFRNHELYSNDPKTYEGNAFTDLAIYRPGETVRASFVVYSRSVTEKHPVTGRSFYAYLYDANGKQVECKQVKPDDYGQMCADFTIPTDRMNGQWKVNLQKTDKNVAWDAICSQTFAVSEYKAPTFEVKLDSTETTQKQGKPAVVKGQVKTFSGMPVSGCQVKGSIKRSTFWWTYNSTDIETEHTFSTTTDANGCFEYVCPAEWTDRANDTIHGFWRVAYIYNVEVRCTDLAGETHQASTTFRVGNQRHIEIADADILIEKGKTTEVDLEFRSSDPAETSVQCHYMLIDSHDTTRVVKQGDFSSDRPLFDWNAVPSGTYIFKVSINDDPNTAPSTANLVLYRESDKTSPSDLPLWMPKASQKVDKKGNADILIGCANELHIYYTAESRNRLVKKGWLHMQPGMHHFSLPMPAQADDYLKIQFISIYDNKHYQHEVHLDVPEKDVVHLAATTFRDRLVPGSHEKWTFRLTDSKGNPTQGRMLLGMYNHALHQLAPNDWQLYVSLFNSQMAQISHGYSGRYSSYSTYTQVGHKYGANSEFPNVNPRLFDNNFGISFNIDYIDPEDVVVVGYAANPITSPRRMMAKGISTRAKTLKAEVAVDEEEEIVMAFADANVPQAAAMKRMNGNAESGAASGTASEKMLDNIGWRESDTKVALWMPTLNCDEEGNFQIEFDAPTDNTSWNFQALAWSKTMASDRFAAIVTTRRPIMVKTAAPRLLHSGDRAVLGASVMNATDKTQSATVVIETFDPRTRAVIASEKQQFTLAPNETKVLTIRCEAKAEMPFIGLRAKAVNAEGDGDGEQIMLPVVSDVEPVIETRPFYAHPDEKEIAIDASVKRAPNSENRLTLEYCNNPTWYVVTALPTLFNEDASTSVALIHNFFAISVAEHYAKNNEDVRTAIGQWKKMNDNDPANPLISNLAKNEDLKIGKLKASPWLNAAEQQTARMTELDKLFDAERNKLLYKQITSRLADMQRSDGGFVWYNHKEAKSSQWATSIILEILGELHQLGCISDQDTLNVMEMKAVKWLDNEMLQNEQLMKKGNDKPDYMVFASYAYLRSFYMKRFPMGQDVSRLIGKTLDACEKRWTESRQVEKAYLALILHRIGRHKAALPIIESIRQYAIKDAKKGMYWKTQNLSYGYSHPVSLTSRLLQAFSEIDPHTEEIDAMRQWLLLEKQTSDWGGSSMAADAAYTLLISGNDWLHCKEPGSFEITCNGKPIEVNAQDQYLGYVRMDLPNDASQIKVTRTGNNPAWGSLYHQYASPMSEIKPAAVSELSIEKELLVLTPDGRWKHVDLKASHKQGKKGSAQLKVGDRVQVRLTIRCSKALEYLTLNDQRPAFLEPKEQLSGYRWVNSTGFYQEIRDEATNLFFYRLPEGVHTIAYECDVTTPGSFSTGVASIQSQYAPQFNAHSAGMVVECE